MLVNIRKKPFPFLDDQRMTEKEKVKAHIDQLKTRISELCSNTDSGNRDTSQRMEMETPLCSQGECTIRGV